MLLFTIICMHGQQAKRDDPQNPGLMQGHKHQMFVAKGLHKRDLDFFGAPEGGSGDPLAVLMWDTRGLLLHIGACILQADLCRTGAMQFISTVFEISFPLQIVL